MNDIGAYRSKPVMKCILFAIIAVMTGSSPLWAADGKAQKAFHATAVDAKGVETDMRNVLFYWEEKVSDTAFVPHEVREMPVKRGTATVKIKFDTIQHLDFKPSGNAALPVSPLRSSMGRRASSLWPLQEASRDCLILERSISQPPNSSRSSSNSRRRSSSV